jgi:nucleotidyltransferase/DNA polymerase involved in DNA repair
MISDDERKKMLQARSIGPRMIAHFEEIGIERLADFAGAEVNEIAMRIDVALGRKHINRQGVEAIANLIALAEAETQPPRLKHVSLMAASGLEPPAAVG